VMGRDSVLPRHVNLSVSPCRGKNGGEIFLYSRTIIISGVVRVS